MRGERPHRTRAGSRIHRGLTGERELIGTRYLADPSLRREYDVEIAPRTGVALAKILAGLFGPDDTPPRRVLDLGAGTGAVGAALRAHFGQGIEVVAVDRVPGPGVLVTDLARALPAIEGRFDLVIAAHLLNELDAASSPFDRAERRAERVREWCGAFLDERGTAIILEPALRETSRDLLAVRDRLIGSGLRVVAPCFWTGPCPALARERDWCHDAADVPGAARVDFSYLALRSMAPDAPAADAALFRIVSDPLVEKGRLRIFGCGAGGRHPLVRLDRHTSPANADFDHLARGDVARITGTQRAGDGLRLIAESVVRRL